MATERYLHCPACERRTKFSPRLFDALLSFPAQLGVCLCGNPSELHLVPPFALGAGGKRFKVLGVFHEQKTWKQGKVTVAFYPFLVVLENIANLKQMVWLPYWHKDGSKLKYGERSPWMEAGLFCRLYEKARSEGYLRETI